MIPSGSSTSSLLIEQNVSHDVTAPSATVAAELLIDGMTLRLFNGADEHLVPNILQCIGGMKHAW